MATREEIEKIVKRNVQDPSIKINEMIEYLCTHSIITTEFFDEFLFKTVDDESTQSFFAIDPGMKYGYSDLDVDVFLRRLPFFLYSYQQKNDPLEELMSGYFQGWRLHNRVYIRQRGRNEVKINFEVVYKMLEEMHYEIGLTLNSIFNYLHTQDIDLYHFSFFERWYKYLKLCQEQRVFDYEPISLIYSYNLLLEEAGQEPLMYSPDYVEEDAETHVIRDGKLYLEGVVPVNPDTGEVVKRWMLLWLEGETSITAENYLTDRNTGKPKKSNVEIIIGINEKTKIYGYNTDETIYLFDEEEEPEGNYWDPIFTPYSDIKIDVKKIREYRKERGYTQVQVAKAINVGERTYQNWETGVSTPDIISFIRLMKLFGFTSIEELIIKERIRDDDLAKFKSGCAPSMFLEKK